MKLHILGICGTFMGSLAQIAREAGHDVQGSDQNVYPPMSDLLREQGIEIRQGYLPDNIDSDVDLVIIGNALSRGNPAVEYVLDQRLPYTSGPQWLSEAVLRERKVLAVAGTHGKTTTSSLLAWLLEQAGFEPGFLIGGVPENFGYSARLGSGDWFVIEADEYDTAFFDKRSKFVHYLPQIAILNNLEYDHADIFPDLAAIQRQFHHLLRIVPASGLVVAGEAASLDEVLSMGVWSDTQRFGSQHGDWSAQRIDEGHCIVGPNGEAIEFRWDLVGEHNLSNAVAASAAATRVGLTPGQIAEGLSSFRSVKRRLQLLTDANGIIAYDDFAHHPTAIEATLDALQSSHAGRRLLAVLEPRSNSMRGGAHSAALAPSLSGADQVLMLVPDNLGWDASDVLRPLDGRAAVIGDGDGLVDKLMELVTTGDVIVFMSNGGFQGVQRQFVQRWEQFNG